MLYVFFKFISDNLSAIFYKKDIEYIEFILNIKDTNVYVNIMTLLQQKNKPICEHVATIYISKYKFLKSNNNSLSLIYQNSIICLFI